MDCLKLKEMHRSLLFFVLIGFTVPRFDDFMYYFKTEVAQFSQFTYSLLTLLGAVALILGIFIYQRFFKETEPRIIMCCAMVLICIASFFDMCFVLRWNLKLGIPDVAWVICSSTAMGTLIFAFLILPPGVLFAKLTPAHVEATMYAFTSSVAAMVMPLSKFMGVFLNKVTFDVKFESLDQLWKLYVLQIIFSLTPLLYIWLLPTWAEVAKVQELLLEQVIEENEQLNNSLCEKQNHSLKDSPH
jgi:Na+/melibiose symporter-like transporter